MTLLLIVALTAGIFVLDLFTPLGWADGFLYLIPLILILFRSSHHRHLVGFAALCCGLIILGWLFSPPGGATGPVTYNRSIGIALLWITALFLRHRKQVEETLESRVEERTTDLQKAINSLEKDITARKRAEEELQNTEEQLRQSQKMEAIGQLAGGIAHDFNNMLTVINGYSEMLLRNLNPDDPQRGNIEQIKQAGERAAQLIRQLLAFSRKQILEPKVLDLNAVVTNADKMLRRLLCEDIDLVPALKPSLGRVKADPGQIEQVILNLAVNARDAMPKGGKLTIETANVELDEDYAHLHVGAKPGPHVMLAVSDTGVGMDAATQAHIFEPFFTTKEQGKGTGLGLAMVYGIVRQSSGSIWVYSEVGRGTTFKIYLPRVEAEAEALKPSPKALAPVRGTETILVAEDNAPLRSLLVTILSSRGYAVLEAQNGKHAIQICEQQAGQIHLLVTDVVMPEISGQALATRLVALRHDIKVLFVSGYTNDTIVRRGVLEAVVPFLQKPFTPETLARKVREVLDTPA